MYSKGLMQLCDYTSFVEELQQDNWPQIKKIEAGGAWETNK